MTRKRIGEGPAHGLLRAVPQLRGPGRHRRPRPARLRPHLDGLRHYGHLRADRSGPAAGKRRPGSASIVHAEAEPMTAPYLRLPVDPPSLRLGGRSLARAVGQVDRRRAGSRRWPATGPATPPRSSTTTASRRRLLPGSGRAGTRHRRAPRPSTPTTMSLDELMDRGRARRVSSRAARTSAAAVLARLDTSCATGDNERRRPGSPSTSSWTSTRRPRPPSGDAWRSSRPCSRCRSTLLGRPRRPRRVLDDAAAAVPGAVPPDQRAPAPGRPPSATSCRPGGAAL